jgi:hypothetical protein
VDRVTLVVRLMSSSWQGDEPAGHLKHDGIRVGEIVAYRAWRVIRPSSTAGVTFQEIRLTGSAA